MTNKKLTVNNVKLLVEAVKLRADDSEAAHGMEDAAYIKVLQAIADGVCKFPKACAKEILKLQDVRFNRWCA